MTTALVGGAALLPGLSACGRWHKPLRIVTHLVAGGWSKDSSILCLAWLPNDLFDEDVNFVALLARSFEAKDRLNISECVFKSGKFEVESATSEWW